MSVDLKISDEQMQTYLQHGFVAVAFDKDGQYYDGIFNWETAQTIAREGYNVVAIANDGNMEKEEIQRICKYELSVALDCFGSEYQK